MQKSPDYWTFIFGKWGDAIGYYGHLHDAAQEMGLEKVNIVYFGFFPEIVEFLKDQKYVGDAVVMQPNDFQTFKQVARNVRSTNIQEWLPNFGLDFIDQTKVLPTVHLDEMFIKTGKLHRVKVRIPEKQLSSWGSIINSFSNGRKVIMVNPYSDLLVSLNYELNQVASYHWDYWLDFVYWLMDEKIPMVLTGMKNHLLLEVRGENILNLVGKTPTMVDVYAIAKNCKGIISTTNSLPMFSLLENIPALIIKNKNISGYFDAYIAEKNNEIVPVNYSLEQVKNKFLDWYGDI